jgi:hypothetical protein
MTQAMPELHDSDIIEIDKIMARLHARYQGSYRNYGAFEREARDLFGKAGLAIAVSWYGFSVGGVMQEGAMPEITVTGRLTQFDPDRQVREVTRNILDIPGEGGVIKTDQGGAFKIFREGGGLDHGHGGHGHSHPR